jgi:AcrR family transcriptional regulator
MGIKERKEREKVSRRQVILKAAKITFFEKGFTAATMDQIAEEAELSKGSLYLHFASKEELYVSLLIEGLEILYDKFCEANMPAASWEAKLRRFGFTYYDFYRQYPDYFHALFFLQHGEIASKVSESLYQTCFNQGLSILNLIAQAIEEGISDGEIQNQNSMDQAVLLWGFINGIFQLYSEKDHRQYLSSSLKDLIGLSFDLIIAGLKRG